MRLVIVTGMSGAGKSTALHMLEDFGYYCIDNLPAALIEAALAALRGSEDASPDRVAVGIDVRNGSMLERMESVYSDLTERKIPCEILFLDAADEILLKRYKETRRVHPLAGPEGRIQEGLAAERRLIDPLRRRADYTIDTGNLLTRELNETLRRIFLPEEEQKELYLTFLTFGYKYGIPQDADLVFDVRFLPNPFYVEELRGRTGLDPKVREFVLSYLQSEQYLQKTENLLRFLIPHYIEEGKRQLIVAIGCTGGCHRSVVLASELFRRLDGEVRFGCSLSHRDLAREKTRMR